MKHIVLALCLCSTSALAALPAPQAAMIDHAATETLRLTGVPAASLAVVIGGKIAYIHAYGLARISPKLAATSDMEFPIGSVSKQFTASMVLLLQQDGKLTLDDKVSKYFPELTRAKDVTIRELLEHTSGYRDFWPEDYYVQSFNRVIDPHQLVMDWAGPGKALDFDPGTAWQYSNTGYAIAGLIVEKAGGAPFFQQLTRRILQPLGMTRVGDYNANGVPKSGLTGYERYGYAPPRPAPLDRPGWSFGSGGLAMTPADLATWDISLMNRSLLSAASYDAMEAEAKLKNGKGTGYGLGVDVKTIAGHRVIEHSGEETGFVTENIVYPDDKAAIVVLTNQDASRAARVIAQQIAVSVLNIPPAAPSDPKLATVLSVLHGLAEGHVDPGIMNENLRGYFSPATIADYKTSLAPLGPPLAARERAHEDRGGMVFHAYEVTYPGRTVSITTYETKDGKLDQFLIVP